MAVVLVFNVIIDYKFTLKEICPDFQLLSYLIYIILIAKQLNSDVHCYIIMKGS